MTAKGTSKDCCCGGCSNPPLSNGIGWGGQSGTLFCCACVPLQLCVEYRCAGVSHYGMVNLSRNCVNHNAANNYLGSVLVDGAVADIGLALVPDLTYQTCSLCLNSTALTITNQCTLLTEYIRSRLCVTCDDCPHPADAAIVEFPITGVCGGAGGTIAFRRAANVNTKPAKRKIGCPDPCAGPYAAATYYSGCDGHCGGCSCICANATITSVVDNVSSAEPAHYCNGTYTTGSGFQVSLVANASTNCCELHLTKFAGTSPGGPVAVVAINNINPCPNPIAKWEYLNTSDSTPANLVTVYFACNGCDGVTPLGVTRPCCPGSIPTKLNAEVVLTPGCMCPSLGAVDVGVPMLWNPNLQVWEGTWTNPADCNNPPPPYSEVGRVYCRMGCETSTPSMYVEISAPLLGLSLTLQSGRTCDPVDLSFKANGTFGGNECGNVIPASTPWTLSVTVTG